MSAIKSALSAVSSFGAFGADDAAAGAQDDSAIERVPGTSGSFLDEIMNKRNGVSTEAPQVSDEEKWSKRFDEMSKKHEEQLAALRADNENFRNLQSQSLKTFEQLAQRPVTVHHQPQAPSAPQLPELNIDDPELAAIVNTLNKRFEMQIEQLSGKVNQAVGSTNQSVAIQNFNQALRRAETSNPEWGKYFNTDAVRKDALTILQANPQGFMSTDWDRELDLAYKAKSADDKDAELRELRKFKAEAEAKAKQNADKQKKNLSQVPTLGARGSGTSGSGLLAESIISDSRKAGKKQSWNQFGRELQRRRSAG